MFHSSPVTSLQDYDPKYRGRYHAEVIRYNASQLGMTSYYGFAFKLADNWVYSTATAGSKMMNTRVSIGQFITSFRDADCGKNKKSGVPGTMVWIQSDKIYVRLRTGSPCIDHVPNIREFKVGRVVPGRWHTLVFGGKWTSNQDEGHFRVWFDKNLRIDETKIKTFMDTDERLFQFRVSHLSNESSISLSHV